MKRSDRSATDPGCSLSLRAAFSLMKLLTVVILSTIACSGHSSGGRRDKDDSPPPSRAARSSSSHGPKEAPPHRADDVMADCTEALGRRICRRMVKYQAKIFEFLFEADKFMQAGHFPVAKKLSNLASSYPARMFGRILHAYSCTHSANVLNKCAPKMKSKLNVSPMAYLRGCRVSLAMARDQLKDPKKQAHPITVVWISAHVCGLMAGDDCADFLGCFHQDDPSYYYAISTRQDTDELKNFKHLPATHHLRSKSGAK